MDRADVKVVFMGTPDFAVPSLWALHAAGFNIPAVVSQPDRPRGRGHKVVPTPVKAAASDLGIPVIQIPRISSEVGVEALRELRPDFLVTVAFGQIISDEVLAIPKYGCVNVHASLLPRYRGASPIAHAMMSGDKETGITTMYTVREVDAGPILAQDSVEILPGETGGELAERLSQQGAKTLVRTLDGILDGSIRPVEQDHALATHCPRFPKGYGEIDWSRPAADIVNFVHGLNPEPGAYFLLGSEKVGILRASVPVGETEAEYGTIVAADPKQGLIVASGDGLVSLDIIRRQGARPMTAAESLRGRKIAANGRLRRRGDG